MSLRRQINAQQTERRLEFGVQALPVVIRKVDGEIRKKQDGSLVSSALLYLTFAALNNEGLYAESEFMIFRLKYDPTSSRDLVRDVQQQVNIFAEILEQIWDPAQVDSIFDPYKALGIVSMDQIVPVLSQKANMDMFNEQMRDQFVGLINNNGIAGLASQFRFRIKVTYTSDGKYSDLPKKDFIERWETPVTASKIKLTEYDLGAKARHDTPQKKDELPGMGGKGMMMNPMGSALPGAGLPGSMPGPGAMPTGMPGAVPGAVQAGMPGVQSVIPTGPAIPGIGQQPVTGMPAMPTFQQPGTQQPQ
jgi:hypothetical protein